MVENEKDIQKIVIHYEDGTEETINKGFIGSVKENDGNIDMVFHMCHIPGRNLENIIWGILQLGDKLGMFDDQEGLNNGDEGQC